MLTRKLAIRTTLTAVALATAVSLTGCLSPGEPTEPSASPSDSTPSASPSLSPSSSPSETTAPEEKPTPVSIPCASVIDAQTMYDFNPNFGLLAKFTPGAGTLAAQAVANQGTACRWMNQTSRETIDVTISQPGPTAFAAARDAASNGTPVSGLGDAAYFSTDGDAGVVQAFSGPFWITATSVYFSGAGDAGALMKDAVAAAR
ncbi:hypothetical protein GCM10022239_15450 [Leifsonia bigeumensis]|uniref:Arginyl-tRNA synthetase n=1 Tax=Leifsonella bigeumensis TaxID=433643 RepID=A0ABP7FPA5_9MICO